MSLGAMLMSALLLALALGAPALFIASKPVVGVALTFFFPPMLFVAHVCRGRAQSLIRFLSLLAITCCSVATVWTLHWLEAYLGDRTTPWLLAARSAGVLYFLPIYFLFIQPPTDEEGGGAGEGVGEGAELRLVEEEEEEEDEGVVDDVERDLLEWSSIDLPGAAVLQLGTTPGTLLHAALRDSECSDAAAAHGTYVLLTCSTVAMVAGAVWVGMLPLESALAYLSVASLVSLVGGYALFVFPGLNTPNAIPVLITVVHAALIVARLAHQMEEVEMKRMDELACWLRDGLFTSFIPMATLTMMGTMGRREGQ